MSKWGRQYAPVIFAKLRTKEMKQECADLIEEMSQFILDLEERLTEQLEKIADIRKQLHEAEMKKGFANASEARLLGYIQRVHELDPEGTQYKGEDHANTATEIRSAKAPNFDQYDSVYRPRG